MNRTDRALEETTEGVLSPAIRLGISICLTGLMGLAVDYLGTGVLHLHSYTQPSTFYIAIAVYAIGLGPLLYVLRKSWVIVPMLLVVVIVAFLELANHYRFIDWQFVTGAFISRGLGSPRIWEFTDGALFGIRQPFFIALVSGATMSLIAPASLWTQRLVLSLLEPRGKRAIPLAEVENLFKASVVPLGDLKVKRDFGFLFLRIFVIFNLAFLTLQIVSLIVGARDIGALSRLFVNPPQTANTLAKETLMLSVALVGAFNAHIRREAALVLLIGHVIAVGAQMWVYFGYAPNPFFPADHPYLLTGIIGDSVVILLSLYVVLKGRPQPDDLSRVEDIELRSPASTILKDALLGMGFLCVAYAAVIVCLRLFASPESSLGAVFGGPDPFVTNMLTRYLALATIFFLLFAKASLRKYLLPPAIVALSLGVIVCFIFALMGDTTIITRIGTTAEAPWFFMAQIVIDGGLLVLLLGLRTMQYQVDYQITSLSPTSADCVIASHLALRELDLDPAASSREVLQRLNEYIAEIRSRRRGLLAFPFWLLEHLFPILTWFRPPFSTMSREEQRWMLRRYILRPNYERAKSAIPPLSDFMSQIGDVINSLLSVAYFTTPRAHAQVGYVLPDARERLQPELATLRPPIKAHPAPLPSNLQDPMGKKPVSNPTTAASLMTPRVALAYDFPDLADEVDYCVIGSGAAGGVLAYRLGVATGKDSSICVLERGAYNSPLQDFSDDEFRMLRMLYTEGGLQMSRTFDFTVLQGESVGGSTVVNNAICLQMPEVSRNEWATFGIDTSGLNSHYDRIKSEINIEELKPEAVNQRVESLFSQGVAGHNASCNGMGRLSEARRLAGNFSNCLGCGLCNIGC
ncbi:MAG TPA: GMC family oxidoreductase N-terminal domain-containing protein, partial [Blastocatellia bacterium]|nr:GMC family oxidoreductase N-terminal domain-containing protein [Blastocatellia bacterium]